jgi:hypothetical protein
LAPPSVALTSHSKQQHRYPCRGILRFFDAVKRRADAEADEQLLEQRGCSGRAAHGT